MRQAVARGFKAGLMAGLTGRVRRTEAPKPMTSRELQAKAWSMTGDALRKAMDHR